MLEYRRNISSQLKSSFLKHCYSQVDSYSCTHKSCLFWFLYKLKLGAQFHETDIELVVRESNVFLTLKLNQGSTIIIFPFVLEGIGKT